MSRTLAYPHVSISDAKHCLFVPCSPFLILSVHTDVDECTDKNGGCDDTCVNTEGSYWCYCSGVKTLNNNGQTCDSSRSLGGGIGGISAAFIIAIVALILVVGVIIYRRKSKSDPNRELMNNQASPPM